MVTLLGKLFQEEVLDRVTHYHPTFFILCIKGLSSLIKKHKRKGDIYGVKVCRGSLILTHLLFVDNCFLFCKANNNESNILKHILDTYDKASGQLISYQKSKVYFSSYTPTITRTSISSLLGLTKTIGRGKYLGLHQLLAEERMKCLLLSRKFIKEELIIGP